MIFCTSLYEAQRPVPQQPIATFSELFNLHWSHLRVFFLVVLANLFSLGISHTGCWISWKIKLGMEMPSPVITLRSSQQLLFYHKLGYRPCVPSIVFGIRETAIRLTALIYLFFLIRHYERSRYLSRIHLYISFSLFS